MNEAIISHHGPGHLWLAKQSSRGTKWQLDRIYALLSRLGDPQAAFPSVVVAGTNGKGSVSSMLAAMLRAGGAKVGHFTSPHLTQTRERVRINGTCVAAERLDEALVAVAEACDWQTDRPDRKKGEKPITDEIKTTPFEALTAAATWLYREEGVDIAVLECGLGGRLDATNCCDADVAVITHIGRDHTKSLGDTIAKIAAEKVAIGRDGRPMIAAQPAIVAGALRKVGINPLLRKLGTDAVIKSARVAGGGLRTEGLIDGSRIGEPLHVDVSLAGEHQVENAALALLAYQEAREILAGKGVVLPEPLETAYALGEVDWPCRAEVVGEDPLMIVDAAHNESGANALVQLLQTRGRQWQVVLAMRNNRRAEDFVRALAPIAHTFWIPRMESKALHAASHLADTVNAVAPAAAVAVGPAERCMGFARRSSIKGSGVVVTGSIYGIGELLHRDLIRSARLEAWLGS